MTTIAVALSVVLLTGSAPTAGEERSVFYPARLRNRAKSNVAKYAWAAAIEKGVVAAAGPWRKMSDDDLWGLMFGPTITRSWMVWSNGHCPACKKSVPMYNWQIEPLKQPWKVRCPHCGERFPKNDFAAFYRSGLGPDGVFDPKRTDRTLLVNAEHAKPDDPLRSFGVDDGEGYTSGGKHWRFIGAYLVYGQWKQVVLGGIMNLAAAYVVTGDAAYAHKAAVLLDRVADLYPRFDYSSQGLVYETPGHHGYVSTWHDACEETRQLALAYDAIREGLRGDRQLVSFLSGKAKQCGLSNPKKSIEDIRRNIESRILRDALKHRRKTESNYPRTDTAVAIMTTILEPRASRKKVTAILDGIIRKSTAVDGVTGEKGLAAYSALAVRGLAELLALYARTQPGFLEDMVKKHPALKQTYRFHIDTWCQQMYYPNSGDSGHFASRAKEYAGLSLPRPAGRAGGSASCWTSPLQPSMHAFLWQLHQITGDADYAKVLYRANANTVAGLPYDLFAEDPAALQEALKKVIEREGATLRLDSVNKQQWHLAILRSGRGHNAWAAWLDYDTGGRHGHADAMTLGLFAKGLDLMPDFGYPPVNYGGWGSPRAQWYTMSAAHNTVVVDGKNHGPGSRPGKTTLWCQGESFRAIRASGAGIIGGRQFERTVAMVDVSDRDFYVLDVFRIVGGTNHAKFMHSHFGRITTKGLSLKPATNPYRGTQMRNFRRDPAPKCGWSVDWQIEDRYKYLKPGSEVHLRYTDLTTDAEALTCEGWVLAGGYGGNDEVWIPRVMVRRRAKSGPLASTFVGVVQPYEAKPLIQEIRRLKLTTAEGAPLPDSNVAVELLLADGRRDLLISQDVQNPLDSGPAPGRGEPMVQKGWKVRFDGDVCMVRKSPAGEVERVAICRGRSLTLGKILVNLTKGSGFVEIEFSKDGARIVSGDPADVADIVRSGTSILKR